MWNHGRRAWLGCLLTGCAPSYGSSWSNAGAPGEDPYLYGPHAGAGAAGNHAANSRVPEAPKTDSTAKPPDAAEAEPPKAASPLAEESVSGAPEGTRGPVVQVGTYRGTDRMTIDLPGFPDNEQVDEKARATFLRVDDDRYAFTVLDTNSGNELCSIDATLSNQALTFSAGQDCFDGILGVPMEAVVYEGEGSIKADVLVVSLNIELTVVGPSDELSGELRYRFEGRLFGPVAPAE